MYLDARQDMHQRAHQLTGDCNYIKADTSNTISSVVKAKHTHTRKQNAVYFESA